MFDKPIRPVSGTLEVLLDGRAVKLPPERRSLSAIRTYLETLALENERILCTFSVDGHPAKSPGSGGEIITFTRVEGQTVGLADMPLRMLESALRETAQVRATAEAAVAQVLINDGPEARELWWDLARKLKEPLLTLSLLPESCYPAAAGCASLLQMRKWQLQQLAVIIKDVDAACWSPNSDALATAIESRALPWLDKLLQIIRLWHQTILASTRLWSIDNLDIDQRSLASR